MDLTVKSKSIQTAKEEVQVIGVFQSSGGKPILIGPTKPHAGLLTDLAKRNAFDGAQNTLCYFPATDKGQGLCFVGLGSQSNSDPEVFRTAGAGIFKRLTTAKVKSAALCWNSFAVVKAVKGSTKLDFVQGLAEGFALANYNFDQYKSKRVKPSLTQVCFYTSSGLAQIKRQIAEATFAAEAVFVARDLSNEPGNVMFPMSLAKRVEKLAKQNGLKFRLLEKQALKKEKMGGLLGVGQGSSNPPCMIILEYKPKKMKKSAKKIALVGKAITFDTGGISLKPGGKMDEMKHDMSGGANMIAATILASKMKCPNQISTYIVAAENMPGGSAIVPSTILTSRSGLTMEVLNTDAEGRLVLADGLDYAQDSNPDVVIDMATLTGAVLVALGNVCSAIMGNDPKTLARFKVAADRTQEKHWELPLYAEYSKDMKGKVGDLRNIGSDRTAGSSKAGAFLQEFIREKVKWIHIDCAGTAWDQRHLPYCSHGATGHGVRTLARFSCDYR